mmetsp:Transcript_6163/g.9174  ORF Transcript_6163/g.9174 Transcript_6163/m.9174 type:complete len:595 (-) Transcript_6163:1029-2813(-)
MTTIAFCTILPNYYEVETPLFNTTEDTFGGETRKGSLVTGCILISLHFCHLLRLMIPDRLLVKYKMLHRIFTPGLSKAEYQTKQAALYKVKSMVKNAYDVHNHEGESFMTGSLLSSGSAYGKALLHFSMMKGLALEEVGGFMWTWKRILTRKLFTEDGVRLQSRVIAGNVTQLLVCIYFASFVFFRYSESSSGVVSSINVFFGLRRSLEGQSMPSLTDDFLVGDDDFTIEQLVMSYFPKAWVFDVSDMFASICAVLACLSIALVYIPSTVSTVLKLRSGAIQSLQGKKFLRLRKTEEQVTMLYGGFFWGILLTALAIYGFVFLVVFLITWNVTRVYSVPLVATLCGLFITVGFKTLVLTCLKSNFHVAFYRKKPAQANFTIVVLECWNLGLTLGYMFVRATKLVLASFLYIGRIDTPFISPEAGEIFGSELDAYPTAFLKDVVSHEAHHHPYLERLGVMYMMKLRYGDSFAKTSGSCWRLLFVFALMPWMRKYRLMQQHENDGTSFTFGQFRMQYKPEKRHSVAKEHKHCQEEDSLYETISSVKMSQLEFEISDIKEENVALKKKVEELETKLKGDLFDIIKLSQTDVSLFKES